MISVDEAAARITASLVALPAETVSLSAALGRVLALDVVARRTQPPFAVSAMDGYAVRAEDLHNIPVELEVVGAAPAGDGFEEQIHRGQAVRIFTGGPVPPGADTIVIQENVDAGDGRKIIVREGAARGRYVRPAGLDFKEGDTGLKAGTVLGPAEIGLAAGMNVPWLEVTRKPRVALLATGNEIVRPGEPVGRHQIVSSNSVALAALVEAHGGVPIDLGIALDTATSLRNLARGAVGADILVTIGGASVGEHDLVRSALGEEGLEIDFWQVAMRPGKPLIFGRLGNAMMLGLPGNPVSAMVCGLIYLVPAMRKLLGLENAPDNTGTARLGRDLDQNDRRQDYLRANLGRDAKGELIATPFEKQDSSMLSSFAHADCLVIRPPFAAAARTGELVDIVLL